MDVQNEAAGVASDIAESSEEGLKQAQIAESLEKSMKKVEKPKCKNMKPLNDGTAGSGRTAVAQPRTAAVAGGKGALCLEMPRSNSFMKATT